MKKLWSSPEVFAAVITIVGTLLVSVLLGFIEGRIGFGSVVALFAVFAVGALIFALHRRGGTRMAVGGGIAMVLIGFLVFFGYRLIRGGLPAAELTTAPAVTAETPVVGQSIGDAGATQLPAQVPDATVAPGATATAPAPVAPPASTGGLIVGVWEPIATLPQEIISLCACPDALYAGATGMIYRSTDAGASWTAISEGLPNVDIVALACFPSAPPRLYAALASRNPFLTSDDGGVTWQEQSQPDFTTGGFHYNLQVAPSDGQRLYFLSLGFWLRMSPNAGKTWFPIGGGLPQSDHGDTGILSLAVHPLDANTLYAGTGGFVGGGHGVYKSTDGGQSWAAANVGMLDLRMTAVAVDPVVPDTVYAGSDAGAIFKSTDGGASWAQLDPTPALPRYSEPREIRGITVAPWDSNLVLLLGDNSGPLASRNGGQTWQMLGKPTGQDQPYFSAVLLVPAPEIVMVVDFDHAPPQRYVQTP